MLRKEQVKVDPLMTLGFTINYEECPAANPAHIFHRNISKFHLSQRVSVGREGKCCHMQACFRWDDISHSDNGSRCFTSSCHREEGGTTDASLMGWGATHSSIVVGGTTGTHLKGVLTSPG